MLNQHLLLEKAFVYPLPKEALDIAGYTYNESKGYWVTQGNQAPAILDSKMRKPVSKKCDVETGEDQKGE